MHRTGPHCDSSEMVDFYRMIVRSERRHVNPVHAAYFADPFVWKVGERYYAIGTGKEEANGCAASTRKVFPLLRSADFYNWESAGRALNRPDAALGSNFWAPAVAVTDRRCYLYYSVG